VKVKYHKAPARLRNSVASAIGAPSAAAISRLVSTKVEQRLAISHTSMIQDIQHVLSLRKENIELHAPTSSTQKLKLMERGGQFTYIPTLPLTWRLPQTSDVE